LGSSDPGLEEQLAWAMLTKAGALERIGARADAVRTYDLLVSRYRRAHDVQTQRAILSARRLREGIET